MKGTRTAVYLVERELPRIRVEELAALQRAAIETSERFRADGKGVRYLRSTFVPGEDRCLCLFEATDPAVVRAVNEAARIPFSRVVEVIDLIP